MAVLGTDEEKKLVERIGRRDSSAMRYFYERFRPYVRGVCARYISDDETLSDTVQNTFIKALSSFGKFKYRGEGSLQAWMRMIAVHESIDLLRKRKDSANVSIDEVDADPPEEEIPDVEKIPSEELFSMVRRLPVQYRTVFNLYVMEDLSHKEIASILGISEKTSSSDLSRARKLLAEMIEKYLSSKDR